MKEKKNGEFGPDMGRLEQKLRRADFSGESRVRDTLRERLLDPEARPRRRAPALAWLVPAAAAAALLLVFSPRHKPAPAAYGQSYSLPDDGYGACGRRGLQDYGAGEKF